MKKLIKLLKKPKGIYYSIIVMITITAILAKFSLAYVGESSYQTELGVPIIDNVLTIEGENNTLELEGNSSKIYTFKVQSKSNIETIYNIYYKNNENIKYKLISELDTLLSIDETKEIKIEITNTSENPTIVEFYISSMEPELGTSLNIDGTVIR